MIWQDLQKHFKDPNTFVPTIFEVIKSWADCARAMLEDEANEAWSEKFLEVVTISMGNKIIKVGVEVSDLILS